MTVQRQNFIKLSKMEVKQIHPGETYAIRKEILRKNIPLPIEFKGDLDADTFHIGVFDSGKLVAVSSFMKSSFKHFSGIQYQLRGMATLDAFRGKGAGSLMLKKAQEILNDRSADYLWCNARVVALGFYRKMGMSTFGDLFTLTYIGDHYVMFKKLE